jgi:hypothetical protein
VVVIPKDLTVDVLVAAEGIFKRETACARNCAAPCPPLRAPRITFID